MNNLVRFQLALRMTTATPPRYNHVAPVDSHSSRAFALIEHVLIHELHAWVYLLTAASSLENFYLWNPLRVCDSCKRPIVDTRIACLGVSVDCCVEFGKMSNYGIHCESATVAKDQLLIHELHVWEYLLTAASSLEKCLIMESIASLRQLQKTIYSLFLLPTRFQLEQQDPRH